MARAITDTQRVIVHLNNIGVDVDERSVNVNRLYALVCQASNHEAVPRSMNAQWVFLRHWLADREKSIAARRQSPEFKPYRYSRGMLEQLSRCAELMAWRSHG